jgi:hypothetical protein
MLGFSSTPETEEAMLYRSSTSEMEEKDFILNLEEDDPEEYKKMALFLRGEMKKIHSAIDGQCPLDT